MLRKSIIVSGQEIIIEKSGDNEAVVYSSEYPELIRKKVKVICEVPFVERTKWSSGLKNAISYCVNEVVNHVLLADVFNNSYLKQDTEQLDKAIESYEYEW